MKNALRKFKDSLVQLRQRRAERLVDLGENYLARGALEEALACSRRSLLFDRNNGNAYSLMARILMPGENFRAVISRFHDFFLPESWVEIGVAKGYTIASVKPETKAIGIDPSPDERIATHAKLYRMTSDEFFKSYDLLEELGLPRLDLAFIDGLHLFEQALRDFMNLERYANAETIVLIHDCLPITRLVASRIRHTSFWCGDVWKLLVNLFEHRPDLRIFVIPAPPSGLGVITNLDPHSRVLAEKYDRIVHEYRNSVLGYKFLGFGTLAGLTETYKIVPNDWNSIIKNLPNRKNRARNP